jgi:putative YhbY family RNA-binding protein
MAALELTPAQRRQQRGLAHHLDPVVAVGQDGLTPAVLKEADAALRAHGLIKIRVFAEDRAAREALLAGLADQLSAAPVQHIGKLLVLWRPQPAKTKPGREERMPGPRTVKLVKFSKSPTHRPTVKKVRLLGNQRVTAGGSVKRAKSRMVSQKKKALD